MRRDDEPVASSWKAEKVEAAAVQEQRPDADDDGWVRRECESPGMGEYRKLKVWEKSHALAVDINSVAQRIRGATNAPLKTQMVRAAMSVPANIVEGRAQTSEKEFARFIGYAIGSAAELEYHLVIALDIEAINEIDFQRASAQLSEVRRMLHGLSKRLRLSAFPPSS